MSELDRWGVAGEWTLEAPPPSLIASLPLRISRLLADARTALGGQSTQDMLAALGKLIPVLREVGGGGRDREQETLILWGCNSGRGLGRRHPKPLLAYCQHSLPPAWPQESNPPTKQGSVTELLEKILQRVRRSWPEELRCRPGMSPCPLQHPPFLICKRGRQELVGLSGGSAHLHSSSGSGCGRILGPTSFLDRALLSSPPRSQPSLLSSSQASLEPVLGQAQDATRKFLDAARDLVQEVRGPSQPLPWKQYADRKGKGDRTGAPGPVPAWVQALS